MNEIPLVGCRTEPLMGYLKALGVFRLVSEQKDCDARMYWSANTAVLLTFLSEEELLHFFHEEYQPSPLVVPWSGKDYFMIPEKVPVKAQAKAPTAGAIIRAFLHTTSDRMKEYRDILEKLSGIMKEMNIHSESDIRGPAKKKVKARFLIALRSSMPDEVIDWMDTAMQLADDGAVFNQLLGSGGGSDGRFHFTDNFMQNLWECLPDFTEQRSKNVETPSLQNALFENPHGQLVDRSGALYDSGAVGGCNATQGFLRHSLLNPWSFVLGLEGLLAFTGGMAKKDGSQRRTTPSFPFLVRMSATGSDFGSAIAEEYSQYEVWLPLWPRPASLAEVLYFFRESRAQVQRRQAQSGLDMARAVATKGVSAGIEAFHRYGLMRGRIGGENYFTATSIGSFRVGNSVPVALFEQLDVWLHGVHRALSQDNTPARYVSCFTQLDRALTDYCRASVIPGQEYPLVPVVRALGEAERILASGSAFARDKKIRPLQGLSSQWYDATDDSSAEFRLAASLAGMIGKRDIVGSLRAYLEPIVDSRYPVWRKDNPTAFWSQRSLEENLAGIFRRRQIDAFRNGYGWIPLESLRSASLPDVVAFLQGQTDDEKISDLLWGLLGVDLRHPVGDQAHERNATVIPLEFGVIRLLVEPLSLRVVNGRWKWDSSVPPPASGAETFQILASGRRDAVELAFIAALRRLSMQGFQPVGTRFRQGRATSIPLLSSIGATRLLASLLFPLSRYDRVFIANTILTISAKED